MEYRTKILMQLGSVIRRWLLRLVRAVFVRAGETPAVRDRDVHVVAGWVDWPKNAGWQPFSMLRINLRYATIGA
jgi:hypothetical protein